MYRHSCLEENAARFADWIATRGGVAVWRSADLSDLSFSMSSPALDKEGKPTLKPHWKCVETPEVVTDAADIEVFQRQECARFHVAVRVGAQGLKLKLTDASGRKLQRALEKAGEGSSYEFDYSTQEAVIYKQTASVSLADWIQKNKKG